MNKIPADPLRAALMCATMLASISGYAAPPTYGAVEIAPLSGDVRTFPLSINDRGEVVGYSQPIVGNSAIRRAFLWRDGETRDLGNLGGPRSVATGINASGRVVGYSSHADHSDGAFVWWKGTLTELPGLSGGAAAYGVNARGMVAGESRSTPDSPVIATLWQSGAPVALGSLGGSSSSAAAINARGQVVGYSLTADDAEVHAFSWFHGAFTDFGTLGGSYALAVAVNDNGVAAGFSAAPGDFNERGFVTQGGALVDIGSLGGDDTNAYWLNNCGDVVGISATATGRLRAFLYRDNQMFNLNDLMDAASQARWILVQALAINNHGQIVVDAGDRLAPPRRIGVVLSPVAPYSCALPDE